MKLTFTALLLCLTVAAPALAASPSPQAQAEITYLLSHLAHSSCDFQRNGSWHSATEAEAHLRYKADYLQRHDRLSSAEEFITLAASQSSLTQQAYTVRCPGKPVIESRIWLNNALRQYRLSRR